MSVIKSYKIPVNNNSATPELNAQAVITFPVGVTVKDYTAHTGTSFNPSTGSWSIGRIEPLSSVHLDISVEAPNAFYGVMTVTVTGLNQDANLSNNVSQIVIQTPVGTTDTCDSDPIPAEGCGDPLRHDVVDVLDACICGDVSLKDCHCWKCLSKYYVVASSTVNIDSIFLDRDTGKYCVIPTSRFEAWSFKYEVYCENCAVDCPGPTRFGPFGPGLVSGGPELTSEDVATHLEVDETLSGSGSVSDPFKVGVCVSSYTDAAGDMQSNLLKREATLGCLTVECQDAVSCISNSISELVGPLVSITEDLICPTETILISDVCGFKIDINELISQVNTSGGISTDLSTGVCAGETILEYNAGSNCIKINTANLNTFISTHISSNPLSLDDLTDVDVVTTPPLLNQLLAFDGSIWKPSTVTIPTSFSCGDLALCSIVSLSDVTHPFPPAVGQVLTWNGSSYSPQSAGGGASFICTDMAPCSLGNIGDVDFSTPPVNDDVLKFNGTDFVPVAASTLGDGWGSDSVISDVTLLGDGTGSSILRVNRPEVRRYTFINTSANYILPYGHIFVQSQALFNTVNITLPSSGSISVGEEIIVKVVDVTFETTVTTPTGVIIDTTTAAGASNSVTIPGLGDSYTFIWDGTNWNVV